MTELPLELDHVGIAVGTLEGARRSFERLGFRLTPRSLHRGAREPGGTVEPWGSGNHCAMFEHGYLEILGIWNPDLWSPVDVMLERYEGAHIVALRDRDADEAHATLASRDGRINPPRLLSREIEVGGTTRTLAFRNILAHRDRFPEAHLLFIEHCTPELLWRGDLLAQPNGVTTLEEAYLCVADLESAVDRYATILATVPERPARGTAAFRLHRGRLVVLDEAAAGERFPDAALPQPPAALGCGLRVRDLAHTRRLLDDNGVDSVPDGTGAILVAPTSANGAVLRFCE